MSRVEINWRCPLCGRKHAWLWDRQDADDLRLGDKITMRCASGHEVPMVFTSTGFVKQEEE